ARRDLRLRDADRRVHGGARPVDGGRDGQRSFAGRALAGGGAAGGRGHVAPAAAARAARSAQERDRRHAQHRRALRRRAHRRAVLERVRRRHGVGARRHRRPRVGRQGVGAHREGRHRVWGGHHRGVPGRPRLMRITANQVTSLRLALTPIPCWLLYQGVHGQFAALVFATLLGCTDFVDGYLARKHGPTVLGGLMDPIADKVFIAITFLPAVDLGWCPPWLVAALFAREFVVTAARSL